MWSNGFPQLHQKKKATGEVFLNIVFGLHDLYIFHKTNSFWDMVYDSCPKLKAQFPEDVHLLLRKG
jgi:hypothetical protein